MASRKDFVQRSRKQSSASPNRPAAAKPRTKATQPPKRKPWALALFSLVALAGLVFILNQLLNVDATPRPGNAGASKNTNHSNSNVNKTTAENKPAPAKLTPAKPSAEKSSPAVASQADNSKKSSANPALPKVVDKSTEAQVAAKQSKYEFYELLPKSEIKPATVEEYKSTPRDAKLDKQYALQAGSFRNAADAEKMRAQLLLSGLSNVHTSQSNGANGLWYRVRLGPFDNRSAMNKAHDKLARMNINAMTIRID